MWFRTTQSMSGRERAAEEALTQVSEPAIGVRRREWDSIDRVIRRSEPMQLQDVLDAQSKLSGGVHTRDGKLGKIGTRAHAGCGAGVRGGTEVLTG